MTETVRSRPAKRSTALDCTEAVSAPGTQVCSEAIVAIGFLMPGRRTSGVSPWISAAGKTTFAGCGVGSRNSSVMEICGSASTRVAMKSSCEPSIIAAIMIEKPTPVTTPSTATSVCRARRVT